MSLKTSISFFIAAVSNLFVVLIGILGGEPHLSLVVPTIIFALLAIASALGDIADAIRARGDGQ